MKFNILKNEVQNLIKIRVIYFYQENKGMSKYFLHLLCIPNYLASVRATVYYIPLIRFRIFFK